MNGQGSVQRFACTQCGKCCNRAPEVELSEAAALADVFVFRLVFRLYWLADRQEDSRRHEDQADSSAAFFERKRLLSTFAARKYPAKLRRDGKQVAYTKYLMISALAVDTTPGVCSALRGRQCGIYDRRPLTCRTVPLHYSRPLALAASELENFVATTGYECDTRSTADLLLEKGQLVNPAVEEARSKAAKMAQDDRRWSQMIARRMNAAPSHDRSLPTLQEIEANAAMGAMTTSMRVAWQVAADTAVFDQQECDRLVELQLNRISHELALGGCSREATETLMQMQAEYREHLKGGSGIRLPPWGPNSTH